MLVRAPLTVTTSLFEEAVDVRCEKLLVALITIFCNSLICKVLFRLRFGGAISFMCEKQIEIWTSRDECVGFESVEKRIFLSLVPS